ncbi:unnamed protein product [Closterium sp. Naga37s-1]|nr:unnamed protein product [Closterium sp. Naga37s-1]
MAAAALATSAVSSISGYRPTGLPAAASLRSSSAFALTPIRALPPLPSAAAARRASPSAPSRGVAVAPRAVIAGLQVSAASAAQWAARMAAFYLLVKLGVAGAEKAGGAESTGGINLVDRVNKALFGNAAEKAAKEAKKAAGSRWHESTKGTLVRRCRVPNVSEGRRTLRSLMALLSEDDLFTDVTSHKGCQIRRETAHSETVCCNNVRAMFDELPAPHIVVEVTVFPPGPLTAMEYQKAEKLEAPATTGVRATVGDAHRRERAYSPHCFPLSSLTPPHSPSLPLTPP